MSCHCEERSEEATFEVTKINVNDIQFEVLINPFRRGLCSEKIFSKEKGSASLSVSGILCNHRQKLQQVFLPLH